MSAYGRVDVAFTGALRYDDTNLEGQDAYSLTNFRGGVRAKLFFAEGWIHNAFNTTYIPVAFAYGPLAPRDSSAKTARHGRSASVPG